MRQTPAPQERIVSRPPVRAAEGRALPRVVFYPSIMGFFIEDVRIRRKWRAEDMESRAGLRPGDWQKLAQGKYAIDIPLVLRISDLMKLPSPDLWAQFVQGIASATAQGVMVVKTRTATPDDTEVNLIDMAFLLKGPGASYVDMLWGNSKYST